MSSQVEQIYTALIEGGYGHFSRNITVKMVEMLCEITRAKGELKPTNNRFVLEVKLSTKVTVIIESL